MDALTQTPNKAAITPTGMCGSETVCAECPSHFLCVNKAKEEMAIISKKNDGFCFEREDETHCVHWWDGEEPCCSCTWDLPK